MEVKPKEQFAF